MNNIAIAAAAAIIAIGSTGVASAQAPQMIGNYSASVLEANNGGQIQNDGVGIDFTPTASIAPQGVDQVAPAPVVSEGNDQGAANAPVLPWTDFNYAR